MRARTEDLLTIRDGEPLDAALHARLVADPENLREIERLAEVADALRRLPTFEPPAGAWERIAAAASTPPRPRARRIAAVAAAALAASTLLIALLFPPWQRPPTQPARDGAPDDGSPAVVRVDYAPLVEESLRLEQLLATLGRTPRMTNAATAITIASLEDRLVLVDEQLSYAEARDADPRFRQALWRERVDLMNALVHVRYAQHWELVY